MANNLGILISGRGSNMQAILSAISSGTLCANASLVLSHRSDAPGLAIATGNGIPTQVVLPEDYDTRDAYEWALVEALKQASVDLVVLAGYMKLVGVPMLQTFSGRMVNIHPSLLPSFKGLHAQKQALDYGVTMSGCTAHYVIEAMDAGPIILQAGVPVYPHDTVDTLSHRILAEEHRVFPLAIQLALNALGLKDRHNRYQNGGSHESIN